MINGHGRTRGVTSRWWGLVGMLCWLMPGVAMGHALLMESSPKQDEALKAPATQAVLRFDARIEKSVTRVRLVDGEGHKLQMPAMGEDTEGQEDRLTIPLPALGAGAYQLQYTVLAADGHATPGILRFTIEAGGKANAGATTQPAAKPATRPAAVFTPAAGGIGK